MMVLMDTFVGIGLVLAAVSLPLSLGWIPPNVFYGFRVRKTLEHPEIWYPVNKYVGERLLVDSLLLVLAAVGYPYIPGIGIKVYTQAVLITWVAGLIIAIVSSFRVMNTLSIIERPKLNY
jgi:hypothetical protein